MTYENKQPQRIGELLKLPERPSRRRASENKTQNATTRSKGANSERASLIGTLTDTLNLDRDGKKYKKLTYARIGTLLAHIPTKDLYYLKRVCEDSKNFSKKFWWEINPKKHEGNSTARTNPRNPS